MKQDISPPSPIKALQQHLINLPLAAFACPMGLMGLGLVWRTLSADRPFLAPLATSMSLIGLLVFAILLAALLLRSLVAKDALQAEINHPIAMHYLGSVAISLLLSVETIRPFSQALARPLFLVAVIVGLAVALRSISVWVMRPIERHQITPAWFLPIVGNLVAPPIAASLGFITIGWFILGFGITGWLILTPFILYRLWAGPELPQASRLSLFIMVAPPGLVTSAWLAMDGDSHLIGPMLFFVFGLFLLLCLMLLAKRFYTVPFQLSWWSTTFPLHALTIAALNLARATPTLALTVLALALAGLTSLITLSVTGRTGWQICKSIGRKPPPVG